MFVDGERNYMDILQLPELLLLPSFHFFKDVGWLEKPFGHFLDSFWYSTFTFGPFYKAITTCTIELSRWRTRWYLNFRMEFPTAAHNRIDLRIDEGKDKILSIQNVIIGSSCHLEIILPSEIQSSLLFLFRVIFLLSISIIQGRPRFFVTGERLGGSIWFASRLQSNSTSTHTFFKLQMCTEEEEFVSNCARMNFWKWPVSDETRLRHGNFAPAPTFTSIPKTVVHFHGKTKQVNEMKSVEWWRWVAR